MSNGVLHYASPTLKAGLVIDGRVVAGGMKPIQLRSLEAVAAEPLQNGTYATQSLWAGPDAPLVIAALEGSLSFYPLLEADYEALLDLVAQPQPVSMFVGWWVTDRWLVGAAPGAQVAWKTSRPFAWDLVARADYPPKAWLIDSAGVATAQTVLATGTPSAGEVTIADSGGGTEGTVTTPAASTLASAYLRVKYPAAFNVIASPQWACPEPNALRVDLEIRELPAGQYS